MFRLCLRLAASYVHLSDNLVVMGSGGSLQYVGPPEKWLSLRKEIPGLGDIEASDEPPPSIPKKGKRLEGGKSKLSGVDATETIKRQTGDWGVWKYYGKSIGAWPMVFALVFVLVSVFTSNFPSKFYTGIVSRFLTEPRRAFATMEYRVVDAEGITFYWNILFCVDSKRFIHGRNAIVIQPLSPILRLRDKLLTNRVILVNS
jgi:hypothetical protein